MSTDGLLWTRGVGSYGKGWGNAGRGINVRQGATVYIRYYSKVDHAALRYADHGRQADGWRPVGPALADGIGAEASKPVILKISDVGTPKSTISWVNGQGKSGIWTGLIAPGPYDLALHESAKWTLPPIVVLEARKPASFWSNMAGWRNPEPAPSTGPIHSVPDDGAPIAFLALALLSLATARRLRR